MAIWESIVEQFGKQFWQEFGMQFVKQVGKPAEPSHQIFETHSAKKKISSSLIQAYREIFFASLFEKKKTNNPNVRLKLTQTDKFVSLLSGLMESVRQRKINVHSPVK